MTGPQAGLRCYVGASLLGIGGYFLLPPALQNLAILATNLVALVTVVWAQRRARLAPASGWLLIAAFPAATAVGNAVYFVNDSIRHVHPFPSVGDAAFLGGYLVLAAGLLRLQRARSTGRDLSALLDTAIVTTGFAAASYVFFMAQLLHDPASTPWERLTALGYPVADVLVVAVAARVLFTAHRRSPAFGWLLGTVLVMLTADTLYAVLNLLGVYSTGNPVDALILAYNLGFGAVALHRRAGDLTMPARDVTARPSVWRLAVLTGASLIAPGVLLMQVLHGDLVDVPFTAAAAALIFVLVVGRMAALVRTVETVLAQRGALEAELAHRAHHDDLTGLANRRAFVDAVERALATRPPGDTVVLFIDLDRFKAVNDSLGHGAGDELLRTVARRLRATVDARGTVARLGGDEFAVLLEARAAESLDDVCRDVADAVAQPVPLQGLDVRVSASIGTARAHAGDTMEDLMHRADSAMYADKTRSDRRANNPARTVTLNPVR